MASVSSLDADMKRLRMSRYTPSAANEVRFWIEQTLGEALSSGDLLDALKDGTVLCRLANMILEPPIKFKKSAMPFIQMENISHFLRACEAPPLNMPSHDRFLTVDLYEGKDPAQVLQCLSAFSRVANNLDPVKFRSTIGPKRTGPGISPAHTGGSNGEYPSRLAPVNRSPSPTKKTTPGHVSKPSDSLNSPGSILYAGYMGGASQGNQGISFGARRQITSAAPQVPSWTEKQRMRQEKEAQEARDRELEAEREQQRQKELAEEEARAKAEEEKRWKEETQRAREAERSKLEQQKREWEDQERKWREEEERRAQEEIESENSPQLRGQYLSEYQTETKSRSRQVSYNNPQRVAERQRIDDLQRQLEEAQERERQYEEERSRRNGPPSPTKSRATIAEQQRPISPPESNASWAPDEREYLRKQGNSLRGKPPGVGASVKDESSSQRPLPDPMTKIPTGGRPLPQPNAQATAPSRPLPNPSNYSQSAQRPPSSPPQSKSSHQDIPSSPPVSPPSSVATSTNQPASTASAFSSSSSRTSWAAASFLERERERERQRQREWEASQQETVKAARDNTEGAAPGQTWDVNQYGFVGGDSQNKGDMGIGMGAKRQILGPRPRP